jgi:hypothetical protein
MLTNITDVKNYLGITTNADDGFITLLIADVQTTIETYCHRHFDLNTYTSEQHLINHKIFTKETPIATVTNIVRLDANIVNAMPDSNGMTNYRIFPGYIELLDIQYVTMGDKLKYVNNEQSYVEISYTAGFATPPADLSLAAIKLVALEYKESREDRIGLEGYMEGAIKETYFKKETEMPLNISCVLDRYARVSL